MFRISAQNEAGVGEDFKFAAATTTAKSARDVPQLGVRSLGSWMLIVIATILLLH